MSVKKVGSKWAVVHAHPKKKDSKTDKPISTHDTKAQAEAQHRAIMASKARKSKKK